MDQRSGRSGMVPPILIVSPLTTQIAPKYYLVVLFVGLLLHGIWTRQTTWMAFSAWFLASAIAAMLSGYYRFAIPKNTSFRPKAWRSLLHR